MSSGLQEDAVAVLNEDTLFLALTRPALWLGVPVEAGILIVFVSVGLLITLGNPVLAIAVGVSLLFSARLIVRTDYNMFRILFLCGRTKARAKNKIYWGGSSYSPLPMKPLRRKGFARA